MKLSPIILIPLVTAFLFSCSPGKQQNAQQDSSFVKPEPPPPPPPPPLLDSTELHSRLSPLTGNSMTERYPLWNDDLTKDYLKKWNEYPYMAREHLMRAHALATTYAMYEPKEIFVELLRRQGKIQRDTLLPREYRSYYAPGEILQINEKNRALRTLSTRDVLTIYEFRALYRNKRVIRGNDDREEVFYNINDLVPTNPARKDMANARCVAAMIPCTMLKPGQRGYTLVDWVDFKTRYTLCPKERFITQPSAADCSAFVVNDSTLITAGHCIDSLSFKNYYFIFDYIVDSLHQPRQTYPAASVYKAKSINLKRQEDICIVRLDRRVDLRRLPKLSSQSAADRSFTYYVIGCPGGVPLKLAGKARIMDNSSPIYFLVNSDTYGGNSGSPVFNYLTNEIEGYITSGADDTEMNPDDITCNISVVCPFDVCQGSLGEKVIRTSQFIHLVNNQ